MRKDSMEGTNIIEIKDLTVQFGRVKILERINLRINSGDFTAILGPNGAGKTTLIKVILGLIEPTNGYVRIFGKKPKSLNREDRRRIGYLPQGTELNRTMPLLVRDVVLMGRYVNRSIIGKYSKVDHEKVLEALKMVELTEYADHPISRLSAGQWQRMLLARALVMGPDLLILDEPTSGLDTNMIEKFYTILKLLNQKGKTIIMVTHEIGVVYKYVNNVACLMRKLVAHGSPTQVLTEEVASCLFGRESLILHHGTIPHIVLRKHSEAENSSNQ